MKKVLLLIVILILLSISTYAQTTVKSGTLTVCTELGYIPFEFKGNKGDIIGFDVDMVAGFSKYLGLQLELKDTEWSQLIPSVMQGQCDMLISGMTITTVREQSINFSDPYYASGMILLVNKSKQGRVNSFHDINSPDITIVTKADTTSAKILQTFFKKANLKFLPGDSMAPVNEVLRGNADIFAFDKPFIESIYNDPAISSSTYMLNKQFTYEPFGAGFSKSNNELLNSFNTYLGREKQNGNYDKLYKYWFNSSDWKNR